MGAEQRCIALECEVEQVVGEEGWEASWHYREERWNGSVVCGIKCTG